MNPNTFYEHTLVGSKLPQGTGAEVELFVNSLQNEAQRITVGYSQRTI